MARLTITALILVTAMPDLINGLKAQNALSGIKDFEDILSLATARGFNLMSDIAMPANNRLLVLQNS